MLSGILNRWQRRCGQDLPWNAAQRSSVVLLRAQLDSSFCCTLSPSRLIFPSSSLRTHLSSIFISIFPTHKPVFQAGTLWQVLKAVQIINSLLCPNLGLSQKPDSRLLVISPYKSKQMQGSQRSAFGGYKQTAQLRLALSAFLSVRSPLTCLPVASGATAWWYAAVFPLQPLLPQPLIQRLPLSIPQLYVFTPAISLTAP